ncbi:sulfate/molybdate ABC transporter ATP-binding protein [Pedobacter endophyticus]|uniref:ATP-binding cassette domain-containing protein n=1 Tax=Pedobacter endophyticus TaxID=2789740 RepID=A0A7S9KZ66_9SPHI|nr:ATP-binding cassette domain-containing protein [Pedobacter endophyticus]QPH39524.1 ATP-binding cassette domain-containing protein [Pedobacter endophyticus]
MINIEVVKRTKTKWLTFELNVNTKFERNAVTQILGPSGIGKTTLLKIIAGLVDPDEGSIMVGDDVWFDADQKYSKKVQERNVGFVFQDYALFPNMTVLQHLRYGSDDEIYIDRLLKIGEMEAFKHSYPKQLSGGQQQRLAILRALSTKPSLLLMDEPFSALDQQLKGRLIGNLQSLFAELEMTVLLVTHTEIDITGGFRFEMGL